jgi:hypothetical protein
MWAFGPEHMCSLRIIAADFVQTMPVAPFGKEETPAGAEKSRNKLTNMSSSQKPPSWSRD